MQILENNFGYDAEFFFDEQFEQGISNQGDSSKMSSTGPSPMVSPIQAQVVEMSEKDIQDQIKGIAQSAFQNTNLFNI